MTILTAVSKMAFSAVWVAEQLKYFEQEAVREKITPAGSGAPCQNGVVDRSETSALQAPKAWYWRRSKARP